jgi:hypothetical protein
MRDGALALTFCTLSFSSICDYQWMLYECGREGRFTAGRESVENRFTLKEKMADFVSFLLESDTAKRRLARLFESATPGSANHLSTRVVARDRSRAARTSAEQNNNTYPEYCCTRRRLSGRTRTAIQTSESGQNKRDLTVSSFVFTLVLMGVILAAYTDQPLFWLLIGPAPVAVFHIISTFLRQRLRRRKELIDF